MTPPAPIDRAEHISALRYQIEMTLSTVGPLVTEILEAVGTLRTLVGELDQATREAGQATTATDTE